MARDRNTQRPIDVEPEDARRGFISTPPAGAAEATADREMADAERDVVLGTASDAQRERVAGISEARTHEERRSGWMASAPGRDAGAVEE